jgi:hypothetical protein
MSAADAELLHPAWAAFARGDIKAKAEVVHPQVRWYRTDALAAPGEPS